MTTPHTATHTPSPWRVDVDGSEIWSGVTHIATLNRFPSITAPFGDDVIEANGRLIALAPEMLAAIETAIQNIQDGMPHAALLPLQAALQKAKGG